jgi:protein arginine kinase activator
MSIKCDKCDKQATIHLTDIADGKKNEVHLCEECAAVEGLTVKTSVPLSQLLEEFVLQKSGESQQPDLKCEVCGMTFAEFRRKGLLGCPNDYDALGAMLAPLLERAHGGASQHVGKVPPKAGANQKKQNAILRLRGALRTAVAEEDYERAARLRDQIKELENT